MRDRRVYIASFEKESKETRRAAVLKLKVVCGEYG